jgi:hypothetical protein
VHTAVSAEDIIDLIFNGEAIALVFETDPEAFALVTLGSCVIGVMSNACIALRTKQVALDFALQHIGEGGACNVFFSNE